MQTSILDAVLVFTPAPSFSSTGFIKNSAAFTTFTCASQETDGSFPTTSTIKVEFVLPDGSVLPLGMSGNGKYLVANNYLSIIRTNTATLVTTNPVALDTGNYKCIASTTPPTTNITAIARLEVKGNFSIVFLLYVESVHFIVLISMCNEFVLLKVA